VHSCRLVSDVETSISLCGGDVDLAFCSACGFIQNVAFDPKLVDYSESYEDTQAFSPQFQKYIRTMARSLVEDYGLTGKTALEIGCGKGDFLKELVRCGIERAVGYDPAYQRIEKNTDSFSKIKIHKKLYSRNECGPPADLIVCRHTLEHIPNVCEFLEMLRTCIGDRENTMICFEVPDVSRILKEEAFWDIYYEHSSYFSAGSLARLFAKCGFTITRLQHVYEDQYLVIEARPGRGGGSYGDEGESPDELALMVEHFVCNIAEKRSFWKNKLANIRDKAQTAVIWGSGSKSVGFMTTLGVTDEISYVVDINPNKQGFWQVGTTQRIVSPKYLEKVRPDIVIVMNPIYVDEIRHELEQYDLHPEILVLV
jgi:SAM-dependent methyltransferase